MNFFTDCRITMLKDPEEEIECPFEKTHMVRAKRFQYHINLCEKVSTSNILAWPNCVSYGYHRHMITSLSLFQKKKLLWTEQNLK